MFSVPAGRHEASPTGALATTALGDELSLLQAWLRRLESTEQLSHFRATLADLEHARATTDAIARERRWSDEKEKHRSQVDEWGRRLRRLPRHAHGSSADDPNTFSRFPPHSRSVGFGAGSVDTSALQPLGRHEGTSVARRRLRSMKDTDDKPCTTPPRPFVAFADQSPSIVHNDYAYVTFVSSAEFVVPAAVLMHSVIMSGSQFSRAVCVTPQVSMKDRARLALFARVIEIEKIPSPLYVDNPRYRDVFTKLRVWQLTMFKKVLYFDSDVVVVRNMDHLFDFDEWAVPMDGDLQRYSTGLMICEPSAATFEDMIAKLQTTTVSMELPDLLFLKEYFDTRREQKRKLRRPSPLRSNSLNSDSRSIQSRSKNVGSARVSPAADASASGSGNGNGEYAGELVRDADQQGGNQMRQRADPSFRISIIPRWYQVYQSQFNPDRQTYLTKSTPITIFDERVHGIHYPGAGKPWLGGMAMKLARYERGFCAWQARDSHDRSGMIDGRARGPDRVNHRQQTEEGSALLVEFKHQPQFLWFLHYAWMKHSVRALRAARPAEAFDVPFDVDVLVLRDFVSQAQRP